MTTVPSPLENIRKKCVDCCGGQLSEVRKCEEQTCSLWPNRMGNNPNPEGIDGQSSSLLKDIRLKCLDCCGGQLGEVRKCENQTCALWPNRMGRNPNRKGIGGPPPVASRGSKSAPESKKNLHGRGQGGGDDD